MPRHYKSSKTAAKPRRPLEKQSLQNSSRKIHQAKLKRNSDAYTHYRTQIDLALKKQGATLKPSSKPSRGVKRGAATLKPKTGPKKAPIKKPTQSISKTATSAASRSVKKTQLARIKKPSALLSTPASPKHYRKKTPRRKS